MSGLTGLFDSSPKPPASIQTRISAMNASLPHRGLDAEGLCIGEGIALGHRRPAIVDLSEAGAQPMTSGCGRFVINFNGEIYNHIDLRQDLEAAGVAFDWKGHSDTETLLAGIVHWGLDETLKRSIGMFAIALWDKAERRPSLARDRMGEKPLYWGWAGSTLVFGSDLKALRMHPGFTSDVCRGALMQYLRFGYVPAPYSKHPGIWKLEPGCVLEVLHTRPTQAPTSPLRPGASLGSLSIRRYWSLNAVVEAGQKTMFSEESAALRALETGLSSDVARQMVADVPLCAFLSGGIDSSLIVALMQKQANRPVKTFTIGFQEAGFNEAPHAAAVARHLGTDHTEIMISEADAREVVPILPDIYDEPFADSSQIPTFLVSREARRHVTVALSGDAGDELFGGYNRYFWRPRIWRRVEHMAHRLRQALVSGMPIVPSSIWNRLAGRAVSRAGDKVQKLTHALTDAGSADELYRNLVSVWRRPENLVRDTEPPLSLEEAMPEGMTDLAARMMVQDMRTYLPDDILCKVDRAAMGVSLETRVPFLDPQILDLSTRLPMHMKIRNNQGKWALRQILYRHVPQELIRNGLLSPEPIKRFRTEYLSGKHDRTTGIWSIIMFLVWRKRWT